MHSNMNSLLFATLISMALVCGISGRAIDDSEVDNSLQLNSHHSKSSSSVPEPKEYVKISVAPPSHMEHQYGKSIELECEAFGSPPPTIQWVFGNGPLDNIEQIVENNIISEGSPTALARVRSKIVIDEVTAADRSYTCVGRAGTKIAHATTTVTTTGLKNRSPTEILELNAHKSVARKQPHILNYYVVLFELMGSDIVLPCKVSGRPRPEIFWFDDNEKLITGEEPRFNVLSSGALVITSLQWEDMGAYTCVAKNHFGSDNAISFVYPVLNE